MCHDDADSRSLLRLACFFPSSIAVSGAIMSRTMVRNAMMGGGGMVRRFASTAAVERKPSLVVLGTGWAGYPFLKSLKPELRAEYDIKLVSPSSESSLLLPCALNTWH